MEKSHQGHSRSTGAPQDDPQHSPGGVPSGYLTTSNRDVVCTENRRMHLNKWLIAPLSRPPSFPTCIFVRKIKGPKGLGISKCMLYVM